MFIRKCHFIIILLLIFCYSANAVDTYYNVSSELNNRYHIVLGSIAAKDTYRIDTYSGKVWQLVIDPEENRVWDELPAVGDRPSYTKPTYQLYLSGIKRSSNFMINTATGNTFEFLNDSKKNTLFLSQIK